MPEICNADLTAAALDAAYWGVKQFSSLPLLTLPLQINETQAWRLLQQLQMVDDKYSLTCHGQKAYQLGVEQDWRICC